MELQIPNIRRRIFIPTIVADTPSGYSILNPEKEPSRILNFSTGKELLLMIEIPQLQ